MCRCVVFYVLKSQIVGDDGETSSRDNEFGGLSMFVVHDKIHN